VAYFILSFHQGREEGEKELRKRDARSFPFALPSKHGSRGGRKRERKKKNGGKKKRKEIRGRIRWTPRRVGDRRGRKKREKRIGGGGKKKGGGGEAVASVIPDFR